MPASLLSFFFYRKQSFFLPPLVHDEKHSVLLLVVVCMLECVCMSCIRCICFIIGLHMLFS
jgi:hypothetical protein